MIIVLQLFFQQIWSRINNGSRKNSTHNYEIKLIYKSDIFSINIIIVNNPFKDQCIFKPKNYFVRWHTEDFKLFKFTIKILKLSKQKIRLIL
jgi:hypothetical protein